VLGERRRQEQTTVKDDPALNPPKPLKYRMRGYGGGPNHTSLHPRYWPTAKSVTYIPGIGYCRTREALPYLRRRLDKQILLGKAALVDHAETERMIAALPPGGRREELSQQAAEVGAGLERALATLREQRARLRGK
jgi:hypothetical protein